MYTCTNLKSCIFSFIMCTTHSFLRGIHCCWYEYRCAVFVCVGGGVFKTLNSGIVEQRDVMMKWPSIHAARNCSCKDSYINENPSVNIGLIYQENIDF